MASGDPRRNPSRTAYGGADDERTYHNIFLVRLDDEGRCFDLPSTHARPVELTGPDKP